MAGPTRETRRAAPSCERPDLLARVGRAASAARSRLQRSPLLRISKSRANAAGQPVPSQLPTPGSLFLPGPSNLDPSDHLDLAILRSCPAPDSPLLHPRAFSSAYTSSLSSLPLACSRPPCSLSASPCTARSRTSYDPLLHLPPRTPLRARCPIVTCLLPPVLDLGLECLADPAVPDLSTRPREGVPGRRLARHLASSRQGAVSLILPARSPPPARLPASTSVLRRRSIVPRLRCGPPHQLRRRRAADVSLTAHLPCLPFPADSVAH
jgi:hypothetical protein